MYKWYPFWYYIDGRGRGSVSLIDLSVWIAINRSTFKGLHYLRHLSGRKSVFYEERVMCVICQRVVV